jgi:hypothetical protein
VPIGVEIGMVAATVVDTGPRLDIDNLSVLPALGHLRCR